MQKTSTQHNIRTAAERLVRDVIATGKAYGHYTREQREEVFAQLENSIAQNAGALLGQFLADIHTIAEAASSLARTAKK